MRCASAKSRSLSPLTVVGGEEHADAVVDVAPLGMMIHALGHQGRAAHEPKSLHEVLETKLAEQLSFDQLPSDSAETRG